MILVAVTSGCGSKSSVDPFANCATPIPGFHSFRSRYFAEHWSAPIDGHYANIVKVDKSGRITWNGVDLSSMHDDGEAALETYLTGLNSIPVPKPVTALDFDAGAPCAKITAVRKLLITHLHCSDTGKCFQGTLE
ncbi:hypothetical protein EWH08_11615 [Sphingobium indicum]|uniref:Uncharacterized protein n=1 Tax=Sphingobium indicum TaxID=332055 RepID=A0A4Q4J6P9_9SPHN|nr:hypothetical protein [Sphingobium indicum]NYI22973.1 hypothetical protein [Sphingobium indicum]RYM01944.1 hypothetical protein EWH08_11615 [Sphingobium indicum]